MSQLDRAVSFIMLGLAIATFLLPPEFPTSYRYAITIFLVVIAILFVLRDFRRSAHDLCRHLTVHYSQKRADGEKLTIDNAHRPYWIVNIRNRRGFAVPLHVKPLVRHNIIEGMTHEGEQALNDWLERNKITINENYPATDDDLGINIDKILHMCKLATS